MRKTNKYKQTNSITLHAAALRITAGLPLVLQQFIEFVTVVLFIYLFILFYLLYYLLFVIKIKQYIACNITSLPTYTLRRGALSCRGPTTAKP